MAIIWDDEERERQGALTGMILAGLVIMMSLHSVGVMVWTATLPRDSPMTEVSFYERDDDGSASYIEVGGQEYRCYGTTAPVGTPVLYDPSTPSRCRSPNMLWAATAGERMGLGLLTVGVVAAITGWFFIMFLSGGRKTSQQILDAKRARNGTRSSRRGRKMRRRR